MHTAGCLALAACEGRHAEAPLAAAHASLGRQPCWVALCRPPCGSLSPWLIPLIPGIQQQPSGSVTASPVPDRYASPRPPLCCVRNATPCTARSRSSSSKWHLVPRPGEDPPAGAGSTASACCAATRLWPNLGAVQPRPQGIIGLEVGQCLQVLQHVERPLCIRAQRHVPCLGSGCGRLIEHLLHSGFGLRQVQLQAAEARWLGGQALHRVVHALLCSHSAQRPRRSADFGCSSAGGP